MQLLVDLENDLERCRKIVFPSPHPTRNSHFIFNHLDEFFKKSTVMIIAELNYSLNTDFVIGHMPVG